MMSSNAKMAKTAKKASTRKKASKRSSPDSNKPPQKTASKKIASKKTVSKKTASTRKPVTKKATGKTASRTKQSHQPTSTVFTQTPAADAALKRVDPEYRRRLIAETSYFIAERRGFMGGSPVDDWLEAEVLVDRRLEKEEGDDGTSALSS